MKFRAYAYDSGYYYAVTSKTSKEKLFLWIDKRKVVKVNVNGVRVCSGGVSPSPVTHGVVCRERRSQRTVATRREY